MKALRVVYPQRYEVGFTQTAFAAQNCWFSMHQRENNSQVEKSDYQYKRLYNIKKQTSTFYKAGFHHTMHWNKRNIPLKN